MALTFEQRELLLEDPKYQVMVRNAIMEVAIGILAAAPKNTDPQLGTGTWDQRQNLAWTLITPGGLERHELIARRLLLSDGLISITLDAQDPKGFVLAATDAEIKAKATALWGLLEGVKFATT